MSGRLKLKCARLAVGYAKDDNWVISIRPASNNFWTNVRLSTESDAFSSTHILLSLMKVFQTSVHYFWNCVTWYSGISYKQLNGWAADVGSLTRYKLHISSCDVGKHSLIIFNPLWWDKHLPGQSVHCFKFFGMFVSTRT